MSLLKLITLTERCFRLVTSVGQRKNSEFPRGIEPQTFGFRALILSLILFTNMNLTTSLTLAVCKTRVIQTS